MPQATLAKDVTLKHRANLGEEETEVALGAGTELEVLKSWQQRLLVKDEQGRLFNVPKDCFED